MSEKESVLSEPDMRLLQATLPLAREAKRLRSALQGVLDDIRLDPDDGAPMASQVSLDHARAVLSGSGGS